MRSLATDRPAFIFDVDEVIVAWRPAFLAWMRQLGHLVVGDNDSCYDFRSALPELSPEMKDRWVERFNHSEAYATLAPVPGAAEALNRLRDAALATPFVVVSAVGEGFSTVRHRTAMLAALGCAFDRLHYVGVKGSKAAVFARYQAGSVVFEDNPRHADAALALGHTVVLFDQPYNKAWRGGGGHWSRVEDWDEAVAVALDRERKGF